MGEVFIGTEAVASGVVTRHELGRWYKSEHQNVYKPKGRTLTLDERTYAAWLWSKREGIVTGLAASALRGSEWVDDGVPVDLVYACTRSPKRVIVHRDRIAADEFDVVHGMRVATPARIAYDLGRSKVRGQAIAQMDALMRAVPYSIEDVFMLTKRYQGARGVKRLRERLPLVDGGAASPQETALRLLYIDAGLPKPTTQYPIFDDDGTLLRTVDLCWEEFRVCSEYDGDQHRTDRAQYLKDLRVIPKLERRGWIVNRVVKEDRSDERVRQASDALMARGWRP